jgi:hypothetical protein
MAANKIKSIERSSLDVSTLSGSYLPINSTGLPEACFCLRLVNDSDIDLDISFDGSTTNDFVAAGDSIEINVPPILAGSSVSFGSGLVIYAAQAAGGTGKVYLSGYYR